jgi:phosphomannomutase
VTAIAKDVIQNSGISFGTSGARGLVSDFTNETCLAYTYSFIDVIQRNFQFSRIAIAIDNRPSSPDIAAAICGAVKSMGLEVVFYGVLPTPALALRAMSDGEPAIMVTGSHIPFDRNGIKFYRPDGEIAKEDEKGILESKVLMKEAFPYLPDVHPAAGQTYANRYLDYTSRRVLSGLKVGLYEHSSAGRDLYYSLLTKMGAEVIRLGRSNEFVPIDTEAVSDKDRQQAKEWSQQYGFDAIFSTDGDGDRPLIADENGEWMRGDIVGLLTSKFLGIHVLAVPVSCNTAIESSGEFKFVQRTKIGSPYVIDTFKDFISNYSSYAGFEANGGFILGSDIKRNGQTLKALPTRDALLPLIVLLTNVVLQKTTLSKFVDELPKRFTASDRIQNVATVKSKALINDGRSDPQALLEKIGFNRISIKYVNTVDGLRLTLDNDDIVHLRPSGNAPELRCYAESDSQQQANFIAKKALNAISSLIN